MANNKEREFDCFLVVTRKCSPKFTRSRNFAELFVVGETRKNTLQPF